MAINREPRGKIVRRLGVNVFGNPKYDKLLKRKPQKPGKAPKARAAKVSEYGLQLAEKGKFRAAYGHGERQFRKLLEEAARAPGSTGEAFLERLEAGLGSVVFRLGWAPSRAAARQLVSHGQVRVNGRRLDVASAALRPGDRLELKAPESILETARRTMSARPGPPSWLSRDEGGLSALLVSKPNAAEASVPGKINLVVEFYAR